MGDSKSESALSLIIQDSEQLMQDGPGPARVIVMSGIPLSGKSHLVSLIEKRVPGGFMIVRSDFIRPYVAKSLGRKRPAYDDIEHVTTFIVASEVIRAGLTMNWPVIADATNLKEEFRRWAYEPADAMKASVLVVFMQVTDQVAMSRLSESKRHGSAATFNVYQKLKYEQESIEKCTKPYIIINSDGDLRPYAKSLANWLTGTVDTVPGLKRPRTKKIYRQDPDAAADRPPPDVYVSEPRKQARQETREEDVPAEEAQPEPAKVLQTWEEEPVPEKGKKVRKKLIDFYTGEEVDGE